MQYQTFQAQPELVSYTEDSLNINICQNERNSQISFSTPFCYSKINKKFIKAKLASLPEISKFQAAFGVRSTAFMVHLGTEFISPVWQVTYQYEAIDMYFHIVNTTLPYI